MKVNLKKIGLFIVLITFFVPDGMTTVGDYGYTQNVAFFNIPFFINGIKVMFWMRNMIGITYCFIQVINIIQNKKVSIKSNKLSIYFSFFAFWVIIDTWLNEKDLYSVLIHMSFCLGFLLIAEKSIRQENDWFFENLLLISKILLIINLFFVIWYPNGITTSKDYLLTPFYFLGLNNQVTPFLIMTSLLLIIDYKRKSKIFTLVLFQLIIVCSVIMMGSGTGLLCVAIMILGYLIWSCKNLFSSQTTWKKKQKHKYIIITAILMSLGIVFFNFQMVFKWLLVGILRKDLSLSGRTNTWELAINQFINRPILGYGYGHMVTGHYYAHNIILELATVFGIVGLVLYSIFCIKTFKQYFVKGNQDYVVPIICATIALIIANTSEAFIFNIPQLTVFILIGYYALERKKTNNDASD